MQHSCQQLKQAIILTASANITLSSYYAFRKAGSKRTLFLLGHVIKIKSEKHLCLHITAMECHLSLQQNGNAVKCLSIDQHHHFLPFESQPFAHLFPSSIFSQSQQPLFSNHRLNLLPM